ncbi:DUF3043 domain-containing protein [Kocuria flava]|uniref:DUF3043 domain-containing protein n=1 Tax=Kocuria flava TaxID=446860 RepID=UPI001FF1D668|nr:DUF3043 domain-containing protein [Kocuria flava]MCJ8503411.1 DUF3043 domain-containing protein [Kocuria flava]
MTAQPPADEAVPAPRQTPGKGRPTPSRREREAARRRPLVPEDRKAAKAQSRDAAREQRLRAQAGLAAGDERFLGPRDRGPQRRFARDWIDSRFNLGEYLLVVAVVALFVLFFPNQNVAAYGVYVIWALMVLGIVDAVVTTGRMKKAMRAKFGDVEPGVRWYAAMRAFSMRRLRLPRPQVKRGERPA